jgi:hypothetical protein
MQILRLTIPELHPGDEDVWPGTPGLQPSDEDLSPGTPGLHPGDEDLSPGTPGLQPSDEDLSPGTAGMKGVWGPVRFPRTKAEEQPQIARLRSG